MTTTAPTGTLTTALSAVTTRGLTKSFGDVQAVRGIDLTINRGEVVAFLGPNGAGKTSTIDMVLGLARPTAGEVQVLGMEPGEAVRRGLVAAVMQTGGLLKDITVRETLELTASLFADTQPVDAVLDRAGITEIAGRRVAKCSGGEQQRLRFAMALLPDPELLVLDEPTTGMDVNGRRGFWNAIREDARSGRTIVFATHYLEEADAYADRVILVAHGRVVADGTAAEVKAMTAGRTVRVTLPGAADADLSGIPAADSIEVRGDTLVIHSSDSDAVARHLLTHTDARDLEVEARGIEDAFISLTSDPTDTTTDSTGALA